jgi:hypothetical protein
LTLRWINLLTSTIGLAVCAVLCAYFHVAPTDFDHRVTEVARDHVSEKLGGLIAEPASGDAAQALRDAAAALSQPIREAKERLQAALDDKLDEFVADVLVAACRPHCPETEEKRAKAQAAVNAFFTNWLAGYDIPLQRLEAAITDGFDSILAEIRRDFRIFALCNAVAFASTLALSIYNRRAGPHLLAASVVLSVGTVLAIIWYVAGQNWVTTIIYNDYWGWSYAILIAAIAAVLADVALNRGRYTTRALNWGINLLGAAFSVVPC